MAASGNEAAGEMGEKSSALAKLQVPKKTREEKPFLKIKSAALPEQQVALKDTVIPFDLPLEPLRGPAIVATEDEDTHVLGPQVLAFANQESWEVGLKACERVATDQCEKGARMGCSVTASRKCQPNWFQRLPFFKQKSTPESLKEREECEGREFDTCISKASQKCAEHAQRLCGDVYKDARVAGKDNVLLISNWEDDDEANEYQQLQTGEKVISSSKGAPWMPPALGSSIKTLVPEMKDGDAERRQSGGKAGSATGMVRKPAGKQGGGDLEEMSGSLWGKGGPPVEMGRNEMNRKASTAGESAKEKSSRQVTGQDGVAYRVVSIKGRTGADGKPMKGLQSLKDGSIKFLDSDGQIKQVVVRPKVVGNGVKAKVIEKGVSANADSVETTVGRGSKPEQ